MIDVIYKFSGELTPSDIDNYAAVFGSVFGNFDRARFEKKFLNDIYGESLFLFALEDGRCVGIQVFWRNDVNGETAYQSCDSAILASHQGKGIFSSLVKKGVEVLTEDVLIYGYPNSNSIHAFRKMGWTEKGIKKSRFFTRRRLGEVDTVDKDYAKWLFTEPHGHRFVKCGKWILIVSGRKYHVYRILGKIEESGFDADADRRVRFPVLFYHSEKGKYGVGNTLIVYRDLPSAGYIADYKLDVDLF